jgi:uncharacterized protein YcfL
MSWKKLFKLLVFLILIGLLSFWLRSDFWAVKKINCRLDNQECPVDLWNKIATFSLQKNLLFFPSQKLEKEIKESFPQTGDLKIRKRIFNTLSFEMYSRKAIVALAVELPFDSSATLSGQAKENFSLSGLFYWLDKDGFVLAKTDKNDDLLLVLIKNDPGLEIGQSFKYGNSQRLMSLLTGLKMHLVETKVVRLVSPREIEIWLDNDILVLFNLENDIDFQLDSLQLILSRAKIEGKTIKKIDLRFDKPVIF